MWPSLAAEQPHQLIFYSFWTGLFLLFWTKLTGSEATLVWDWYDLDTRMHYYGRKIRLHGKIMLLLEERIAPSHFDGLIIPTFSAQRMLHRWKHPISKTHVLGEIRELNPYVSQDVLETRVEEVVPAGPIHMAWVGIVRHYQLDGPSLYATCRLPLSCC